MGAVPLRRVLGRAAFIIFPAALVLILVDQWPFLTERFSRGQVIGRDAFNFWFAGHLVTEGRLTEVYDPAAFGAAVKAALGPGAGLHVFPYPPPVLLGVVPFGWLPYEVTLVLWSLIGAGAFILAVGLPRPGRVEIWLGLAAPMTLVNLAGGQNGLLSAALFIGGLRLAGSRPGLAGLLIGMLIFKPFLGLLLPLVLLFQRRWMAIAMAGAMVIVLCLVPVLVWGEEVWHLYLTLAAPYQQLLLEQGTGPAQWMKPSVFMSLRLLGAGLAVSYGAQLAFAVLVLAMTVPWLWRRRELDATAITVTALATALIVPYVHIYDLAVVAGGQILMQRQDGLVHRRHALVFSLLWMIPLLALPLNIAALPVAPLVMLAGLVTLMRMAPDPR